MTQASQIAFIAEPNLTFGSRFLRHFVPAEWRSIMAEVMKAIPFTQFSMEMRSGKIIDIDDGFTELLGYSEDDFEAGIVFKQFVPSVEYEEVITELREKFIDKRYVSYIQEFVAKDGKTLKVVAFYKIENKLLAGHRVIKVSAAVIE